MELGNVLTVREAATRLGLPEQRIRLMLSQEELAGERVGPIWLISTDDVERVHRMTRQAGRPFGERLAWAVIGEGDPQLSSYQLSSEERTRARRYRSRPFGELAPRLRRRAGIRYLSIDPQRIGTLANDPRCVLGGQSGARQHGAELFGSAPLELYVTSSDADTIEDACLAVTDRRFPNLLLRTVQPQNWPFGQGSLGRIAPARVIALDLFDTDPSRASLFVDLWDRANGPVAPTK